MTTRRAAIWAGVRQHFRAMWFPWLMLAAVYAYLFFAPHPVFGQSPTTTSIPCPTGCICQCVSATTTTQIPTTSVSSSSTIPSTTSTTLPPPCTGPLTPLPPGTRTTTYRPTIAAGGWIDASGVTFISGTSNRYPVQVSGANGGCWFGGTIRGTFDRTLTWNQMHDDYNPTAFRIGVPGFLVQGLRIDNGGDGIKTRAKNWTVRGAHLTWIRDDCIENIDKLSGLVEDSLLEECYVGMSTRSDTVGSSSAVVSFRRVLLGLKPMPGPHESEKILHDGKGHGNYLKTSDDSPQMILEDNVFFAEQQTSSEGGLGLPSGTRVRCKNNVMLYAGREPLRESHFGVDEVSGKPCFVFVYGQAARDRWALETARWKATHR